LLFDGAVTLSPPVPSEKEGRQMRWPMLKPCVTEESAINDTLVTLVALGVPTKNGKP
jgi:hypothetical protein